MAEYEKIKRPIDKKSGQPIEPAHKFEVNLEGDSFTKEKYVTCRAQLLRYSHRAGMMFFSSINCKSTKIPPRAGRNKLSSGSSAVALIARF